MNNKGHDEKMFSTLKAGYESVPMTTSVLTGNFETFSHTLKHPYVSLSPEMSSAFKNSQAGGYKLAVLSSASIPIDAENVFFNVKVVKSTGSILLGLGIAETIRNK